MGQKMTNIAKPIIKQIKDNREALDFFENILLPAEDEIINMKMSQNGAKYPVEKAKGSATKYDQL